MIWWVQGKRLSQDILIYDVHAAFADMLLPSLLSGQVPAVQLLVGQLCIINSQQMFSLWRLYVVVGAAVALVAVLTPSSDPYTQALLVVPLVALYIGGALMVRALEDNKAANQAPGSAVALFCRVSGVLVGLLCISPIILHVGYIKHTRRASRAGLGPCSGGRLGL